MSEDEMRAAVAIFQGWNCNVVTWFSPSGSRYSKWKDRPDGTTASIPESEILPDYPNDLNEMHEVEKSMLFSQRLAFKRELQFVMSKPIRDGMVIAIEECIHATAHQRCEAYLRVKGLWRDTAHA